MLYGSLTDHTALDFGNFWDRKFINKKFGRKIEFSSSVIIKRKEKGEQSCQEEGLGYTADSIFRKR